MFGLKFSSGYFIIILILAILTAILSRSAHQMFFGSELGTFIKYCPVQQQGSRNV
jgi:hypothetical protein